MLFRELDILIETLTTSYLENVKREKLNIIQFSKWVIVIYFTFSFLVVYNNFFSPDFISSVFMIYFLIILIFFCLFLSETFFSVCFVKQLNSVNFYANEITFIKFALFQHVFPPLFSERYALNVTHADMIPKLHF